MNEKKSGLGPLGTSIDFGIENSVNNINDEKTSGIPVVDAANKVEKLIFNDTLTGFENRRGLNRYKNNLKSNQYPLTFISFDLDNLKKINDNPDPIKGGHTGGDNYILSFVEFIEETFPDSEKVRLGGDEFAVVFSEKESTYFKKIEDLYSILEDFNEKKQNPNNLEFTYGVDTASSGKDFYEGLKRSDGKLVENKRIKKIEQKAQRIDQGNLSSDLSTSE